MDVCEFQRDSENMGSDLEASQLSTFALTNIEAYESQIFLFRFWDAPQKSSDADMIQQFQNTFTFEIRKKYSCENEYI